MWTDWSACTAATCTRPGVETRTRMYADKKAAMDNHCSERLEEQRPCTIDCGNDKNKMKEKPLMMGSFDTSETNIDMSALFS